MPDELRFVGAAAVSLLLTLAATPVAIKIACRTGFYDRPAGYKGHLNPTPYLGGAAVTAGFLGGAILFGQAGTKYAAVLIGALLLWSVGTVDDWRTVTPGMRLLATTGAAVLVFSSGLGWTIASSETVNLILSVLWVLAVVNAFNLMDNMDGAAATVAAVALSGITTLAMISGAYSLAALTVAAIGGCAAFLRFNLADPARIFLGDGGSMALGFVAAASTMAVLPSVHSGWTAGIPAALLVGLPAFDTALVIVSRYRRKVTIWSGGRDHVTHRLLRHVGSVRRVALVLGVAQGALGALAVGVAVAGESTTAILLFPLLALALLALFVLETSPWQPSWNGQPKAGASPSGVESAPNAASVRMVNGSSPVTQTHPSPSAPQPAPALYEERG